MICPKCNKRCETTHDLDGEKVAVCDGCGDVWRLSTALEFARSNAADARLGRLVRGMPGKPEFSLAHVGDVWWVTIWEKGSRLETYGDDTPEVALIEAGVKEGE